MRKCNIEKKVIFFNFFCYKIAAGGSNNSRDLHDTCLKLDLLASRLLDVDASKTHDTSS